jgi:allantoate deiminase
LVRLTLDVRHAGDVVRTGAVAAILDRATTIAGARGVAVACDRRTDVDAVTCDATLTAGLASAVAAVGYPVRHVVSGAGHDAVALSARMPVAMLFVRCAGGISHNPAESVTVDDVAAAIEVLDHVVLSLVRTG